MAVTTEIKRPRLRTMYHLNDIELHRLQSDPGSATLKEIRTLILMGLTAHQVAGYLVKSADGQAVEAAYILQGYLDREVDPDSEVLE